MTREEAHKLVDYLFDNENSTSGPVEAEVVEEARVLPANQRVVRTKNSGDRVYMLDEDKKTRQWVTNAEVLKKLGFEMEDVKEIDDTELLGYQMAAALYRVE